jgi:hypothetical protein
MSIQPPAVAAAALTAHAYCPRPRKRSWLRHGHGRRCAGLVGFGVGAIVGSALAPREVYVAPPPPAYPAYYGPAAYGPPPWSPGWYSYCRNLHGPYFNPNTGYFQGADGGWYFCR